MLLNLAASWEAWGQLAALVVLKSTGGPQASPRFIHSIRAT